jgi:hypothetical protein
MSNTLRRLVRVIHYIPSSQVKVFWVVTSWHFMVEGPNCLYLQGKDAASKPPKRWHPATTLHGVTTQKISTWIFAVKTTNLVPGRRSENPLQCVIVFTLGSVYVQYLTACRWVQRNFPWWWNKTRVGSVVKLKYIMHKFWIVTPCSVAVGHQRFGGPRNSWLCGKTPLCNPPIIILQATCRLLPQLYGLPFLIILTPIMILWVAEKVKLSLCLTKYEAMKTYPLLN